MVGSTLSLATGALPHEAAFDLRDGFSPTATHIAPVKPDVPREQFDSGDVWINYPFPVRLTALACIPLDQCNSEPQREEMESQAAVRDQIYALVDGIEAEAKKVGISGFDTEWALTELILNATQYGRLSPSTPQSEGHLQRQAVVGLVRVEWSFDRDPDDPSLRISVSNPATHLFNPSHYLRMSLQDHVEQMSTGWPNSHAGVLVLMGKAKPETSLRYLWELEDGSRICCSMSPLSAEEAGDLKDSQQMPVRLSVGKYDEHNQPLDYDEEQFMSDVAQSQLKVRSLTISCVLGKTKYVSE